MNKKKWLYAIHIGFYAGLIWGVVKYVFYYFKFTKVLTAFFLTTWYEKKTLESWGGQLSGFGGFIVFSIVAAIIYMLILQKRKGAWAGILYGFVWWAAVYVLIGPLTGTLSPIQKLDMNSILSDACIFVLWGVFIGYSIALEFTDERNREPQM